MDVELLGTTVSIAEATLESERLYRHYMTLADSAVFAFDSFYQGELSDQDTALEIAQHYCYGKVRDTVQAVIDECVSREIFEYNLEIGLATYDQLACGVGLSHALTTIDQSIATAYARADEEAAYRSARRANRFQVVGGGFGLGGALKGIAEAAAINMITGAAHGLTNAAGNAMSRGNITSEVKAIREQCNQLLREGLRSAICDVYTLHISLLGQRGFCQADSLPDREVRIEQAAVMFGHVIEKKIPPEKQVELAKRCIQLDPADTEYLIFLAQKSLDGKMREQDLNALAKIAEATGLDFSTVAAPVYDGYYQRFKAGSDRLTIASRLRDVAKALHYDNRAHSCRIVAEGFAEEAIRTGIHGFYDDADRLSAMLSDCSEFLPITTDGVQKALVEFHGEALRELAKQIVIVALDGDQRFLSAGRTPAFQAVMSVFDRSDLDHCVVTATNEILAGDQSLAWALPRLENMVCIESAFFQQRLQGYFTDQKDKAIAWLKPRAEAAVANCNLNEAGAVGRATEILLPIDNADLLTQAARSGFAQMLDAGPKDKPEIFASAISRLWHVDTNKQWRDAVVDWLAWRFIDGTVRSSEQFAAYASQLMGSEPDPTLAQDVYDGTLHVLLVGDRESPSNILANSVNILGVSDPWITGPVPAQSLHGLRDQLLQGVGDLPGELMLATSPRVVEVVSQLRAIGWYFSLGGAIAIVAGRGLENCYALTPNGIFRSSGLFHPYAAISKVEPVQGWTQHYVKYQIGEQFFELNKLGAMTVANFLSTVISNGMRMAREPSADQALNLFAGRDAAAELYLDRWAGIGHLVLVTDERKMLPASLAREKMLLGLLSPTLPLSSAVPAPSAPSSSASAYGLSTDGMMPDEMQGSAMSLPPCVTEPTLDSRPYHPVATGQTDVPALILDLCSRYPGKGFGIGDGIEARKLQSARKAFPMPLELKVYGLLDSTLLGTNEKGLAITANGMYWKNGWTQETLRNHLPWREFNEIQIEQRFDKFGFGPGNFFETTGSSYPNGQLNNLLSALQASLRLLHITGDGVGLDANNARPSEGATMKHIIEWACNNHSGGGIAVGELINPKKLSNARNCFQIPISVDVIGLIDCTAFGSNKIGLAICTDGIYWKNDWTTKSIKTSLSWSELPKRNIGGASDKVLFGHDAVVGMSAASVKPATVVAVLKAICEAMSDGHVTF